MYMLSVISYLCGKARMRIVKNRPEAVWQTRKRMHTQKKVLTPSPTRNTSVFIRFSSSMVTCLRYLTQESVSYIPGRFKSCEIGPVILSAAKNLCRMGREILRCAQNDRAI